MKLTRTVYERTLVLLCLGLISALAANVWGHKSEPENEAAERRINALVRGDGMSNADQRMLESIGADALIYLIPALTKQDTLLERSYAWLYPKLPGSLRDRLDEPEPAATIRANAASLVTVLGPKGKLAVPYLAELLQDEAACANAAVSLGAIGPEAVDAMPALIRAVDHGVPFAAIALGKIGNPARTVLQRTSREGPTWQRTECEWALKQSNAQDQESETQNTPVAQIDNLE